MMGKYTIEYTRTVRVAPYETLKIGLTEEFDTNQKEYWEAFNEVESCVNSWIARELNALERGERPGTKPD